jgi:hypothetical protein
MLLTHKSLKTQMRTGLVLLVTDDLLPATAPSLEGRLLLGRVRSKMLWQDLVQRQSTELWCLQHVN